MLIFLSNLSTNFERFGAYPAAYEWNFPRHTNSLSDFRGVMAMSTRIPVFLFHIVLIFLWMYIMDTQVGLKTIALTLLTLSEFIFLFPSCSCPVS